MSKRTPKIKQEVSGQRKPKYTLNENYKNLRISWRLGKLDIHSKWGYSAIKGKLQFNYSESLLESIIASENDTLNTVLEGCQGKKFENHNEFMKHVNKDISNTIDNQVLSSLMLGLSYPFFFEKIFPPIKTIEQMSWNDIEKATHGRRGKSNSHFISIADLPKAAKNRLEELGYVDVDEIYSLRLDGKFRIYGFRNFNCLDIIWIDTEHEIWNGN